MKLFRRRKENRIPDKAPVRVLTRRLQVNVSGLELISADVSRSGLQVACPELRFVRFEQAVQDGELDIQVAIPGGGTVAPRCRVAYSSTYGDEVLVGLQFQAFSETDRAEWDAYIWALGGIEQS